MSVELNYAGQDLEQFEDQYLVSQETIDIDISNTGLLSIPTLIESTCLELLDLSYNQIKEIQNLNECRQLNSLSLAFNQIHSLGDLINNQSLEVLDLRNNGIKTLEDIDLKLPNSLKTLYLQQNDIDDILQPRLLNFLDNIQNINLTSNPIINKFTENNIDSKLFILFLLNNKAKKINNQKITELDRANADLIFNNEQGLYNQELSDAVLMMQVSEEDVFSFYKSKKPIQQQVIQTKQSQKQLQSSTVQKVNQSPPNKQQNKNQSIGSPNHLKVNQIQNKELGSPSPNSNPIYEDVTSYLMKGKPNMQSQRGLLSPSQNNKQNAQSTSDILQKQDQFELREKVMSSEIQTLREEVGNLKSALSQLEEKYDLQLEVQKKRQQSKFKYNKKGQITDYLKLDQIAVSTVNRKRALPKSEFKLAKVQGIIRGVIVRKRYQLYQKQQKSIVKIQALMRGIITREKLKKDGIYQKLKEKKEEQLCCKKCQEREKEILMLMQKISTINEDLEEHKKSKVSHEKALRYLFDQVASLRQVIAGDDQQ
eukprot:403355650